MPFVYVNGLPADDIDGLRDLRNRIKGSVAEAMGIDERMVHPRFHPDILMYPSDAFIDVLVATSMFEGDRDPEGEQKVALAAVSVIFEHFHGHIPVEGFVGLLNARSQAYIKPVQAPAENQSRSTLPLIRMSYEGEEFAVSANSVSNGTRTLVGQVYDPRTHRTETAIFIIPEEVREVRLRREAPHGLRLVEDEDSDPSRGWDNRA